MDRNLKILMLFLILLFIYDLFCRKSIEGFTDDNFVYYSESLPGPNYTPIPNLMDNASINSFTYDNPSEDGLDNINLKTDPFYYKPDKSKIEKICRIEYPNWQNGRDKYNTTINGSLVNLYDKCIKDGLSYKKELCLKIDSNIPRGKNLNGSNVFNTYYKWDTFPDKTDSGMCTYTPPSVLTNGQYCSSHTDKNLCNASKTHSGEKHCIWTPSFRSYPSPTKEHNKICNDQNNQEPDNSADKESCENAMDPNGFRPCKFSENTLIVKASDNNDDITTSTDVSGTCEVDYNNYIGGLNLDEVRFYSVDGDVTVDKFNGSMIVNTDSIDDKSKLYRYINSGKCMENCSVSSASECNNRYSCVWVDNIKPKRGIKMKNETDNLIGSCVNKEIYFYMKDKDEPNKLAEKYDHTKICKHYNSSQTCNSGSDSPDAPSRLYDDSWHCKWKHYLGMCDQIGVKQIKDPTNPDKVTSVEFTSQNGSYTTNPEASSCQTLMANHVISKMNQEDIQNPIKQFEYMADPANESELKDFCNNYRYESTLLKNSDGYDSAINTSGAQFCLWKPPRDPDCSYKGAPDLVNPGEYYSKNNQPFGKFTYQEPAFYYSNIFPPMCSLLNNGSEVTEDDCKKVSRNCSWTDGKCKPRCIRVGSNNNLCGKSALDQYNKAVEDNKFSSTPDYMLADDADKSTKEKAMKRFDDYSHCKFNEELNTCVLNKDYDNWINGGPWSSEIETQKWT